MNEKRMNEKRMNEKRRNEKRRKDGEISEGHDDGHRYVNFKEIPIQIEREWIQYSVKALKKSLSSERR
jgi:hypothetical protein